MTSASASDWSTPWPLVDELAAEFAPGGFDLDPAASAANAKAAKFFTVADDGLSQDWKARACFVNPPYGRQIGRWVTKAIAEVQAGRAERVVILLPSRTDTQWWREATAAASLVRFLPGRIRFSGADRARWGSMVAVFGELPGRVAADPGWCGHCGCRLGPAAFAI